jgi:HK97 family phage major capsid protein
MTVIELRERAVREAEAARAIKDTADQESRHMTAEEALKFDKHIEESERLEKEAERQEKLEAAEKRLNEPAKRQVAPELANGQRIEVVTNPLFRFGKLRAFKGKNAEADAYKSGRWLMATVMGDAASRQWCRDHGIEIRVQTEGVNSAGGFVVPDVMERAIIDLRETYGMFRANARKNPMSSDHTWIPRRVGGVTAYFVGESGEITASDKEWNQVELTAKKLAALTRMSTELSEDAIINIADDLADEMAWAFAKKEDECGLDGDGTSTYGGMIGIRTRFVDGNHTAGQTAGVSPFTTWAGGTLAAELTPLMALLPAYALPRAKWYISSPGKIGLLDAVALAAGGNTTREIASGAQPQFGGYPIVVSAAMPAAPTNATVAVLFGDLTMSSTLGDRRGITISVSTDRYFENDQIGIKATERFCVVNHDIGDNTTAGPVVALVGTT